MAKFYPYTVNSGQFNMDFDQGLVEYVYDKKEPVLRLYGWSPACVSLGRNQDVNSINEIYCRHNGIDIVVRPTGGRALFHSNELTYSFVCPVDFLEQGESVILSYKEISGAIKNAFSLLNIEADFPENKKTNFSPEYCMSLATGADLSFCGKKLVGSAQYRKQGIILQHGSILFNYNVEIIKNIFGQNTDLSHITTINDINPEISIWDICQAMKTGFENYFKISFEISN